MIPLGTEVDSLAQSDSELSESRSSSCSCLAERNNSYQEITDPEQKLTFVSIFSLGEGSFGRSASG